MIPQIPETLFQGLIDDLKRAPSSSLQMKFGGRDNVSVYHHVNDFLTHIGPGYQVDMSSCLNLAKRNMQLEFLKMAVGLLSNNAKLGNLVTTFVDLCNEAKNLTLLQNLLNQRLPSIDALAETVLSQAVCSGNLKLFALLLEHTEGADGRSSMHDKIYIQSLLSSAICAKRLDVVRYLLDYGANSDSYSLKCAIALKQTDVITELLKSRHHFQQEYPRVTVYMLQGVIDFGGLDLVDRLFSHMGASSTDLRMQSRILDSVGKSGEIDILEYFLQQAFDLNATDEYGCGSPLASALLNDHVDLALYMIERGANINRFISYGSWEELGQIGVSARTPLQVAISKGQDTIIEKLLHMGADPNLTGIQLQANVEHPFLGMSPSPLELACQAGDIELTDTLLRAGADTNACKLRHHHHRGSGSIDRWARYVAEDLEYLVQRTPSSSFRRWKYRISPNSSRTWGKLPFTKWDRFLESLHQRL